MQTAARRKARTPSNQPPITQLLSLPGEQAFGRPRPANFADLMREYWGWMHHCAVLNAMSIGGVPLRLYMRAAAGKMLWPTAKPKRWCKTKSARLGPVTDFVEVTQHPALDIVNAPNPHIRGIEFKKLLSLHLDMIGNAFVFKQRGARLEALWPLPPQYMRIVPSETEVVGSYIYEYGAQRVAMDRLNIAHARFVSPIDIYFYGIGSAQSEAGTIQLHDNIDRFQNRMFANNARPDALLIAKNGFSQPDVDRLKKDWFDQYGGVQNVGKLGFLSGDVTFEMLNFNPQDISHLKGDDKVRLRIGAAFGIPGPLLSTEGVSLANYDTARTQHCELAILPRLRIMEDFLTAEVAAEYDPRLIFAFDDPTPDDSEFRLKEDQAFVALGVRTINEVRADRNWQPVEWGDEPRAQAAPVDAMPPAQSPQKRVRSQKSAAPPMPEDSPIVRRFAAACARGFTRQRAALRLRMEHLKTRKQAGEWGKRVKLMLDDVEDEMSGLFGDQVYPSLQEAAQKGGDLADAKLRAAGSDAGVAFDVHNPETNAWLKDYGGFLSRKVYDGTRDKIKGAIDAGLADGDSIPDITSSIMDLMDEMATDRAATIARTETSRASHQGGRQAYRESGVVAGEQWAVDGNPCEFCQALDGKIVSLDESFAGKGDTLEGSEGGTIAVDYDAIDGPPAHPLCECTTIPILKEADDD